MRPWVLLLLVFSCGTGPVVSVGSAELAIADTLTLPPTALGFSRRVPLTVMNRGRLGVLAPVSVDAPFFAAGELSVPGGAETVLEVTFTPTAVGPVRGTLLVDGQRVDLLSEGVSPLDCAAEGPCTTTRFDPDTLTCLQSVRPDGEACSDERRCIEGGQCQQGACLGRAARCDDGNACTTDACAVGVGCQYAATTCEAPTNPCLAALCDAARGCTTAPVQDGTPCGAVSCELANVCLAGTCRAVTPPDGFTCAPESACRGEGGCRARRCVQPAERPLAPRWSYTSSNGDLRFDGVVDAAGHWYWVECGSDLQTTRGPPGHRCEAHSRTPEGLERFRTSVTGPGVLHGTVSGTQLIANGLFLFVTNETTIAAVSTATGALAWKMTLATLPTPGFRGISTLADDGLGQVWAVVRADQNRFSRTALVRLDVQTGAVRGESVHEGTVRGVVLDSAGRLFGTHAFEGGVTGMAYRALIRVERDGRETLRVALPNELAPVLVIGDEVVFEDDSVRSAIDGREVEPARADRWSPLPWGGVAPSAQARFRLARNQLDDLPPTIALTKVERGQRSLVSTFTLPIASELHLTASGDALFVTASSSGRGSGMTDTRLRQVHPRGPEVMNCPLVDEADLEPGGAEQPLQVGAVAAFSGRWLAVRTVPLECPVCADGLWTPPRVAFYDLGRTAPGLSASGWVNRRGTPGASLRPR
jgi:hypothetical protein